MKDRFLDLIKDVKPSKEESTRKRGERKVSEGVFDNQTLMTLYKLSRKNAFSQLTGIVSTGKEANVYHGLRPDGSEVAAKIYCIEACEFKKKSSYLKMDPRVRGWRNQRQMVYQWSRREYHNMLTAQEKKVSAPKPVDVLNNVLVMEFIGVDGIPSPRLKDLPPENPSKCLKTVLKNMKNLYQVGLVHGDLSEYNILNHEEKPILIDFSHGIPLNHPNVTEFLDRDIHNIARYFKSQGIDAETEKLRGHITGE